MKSFTELQTEIKEQGNNTAEGALFKRRINDAVRFIVRQENYTFLEKSETATTVASTQFYDLPRDYGKLISVSILVSTTTYTPREAPNRAFWDRLNQTTNVSSSTVEWFFIFNNQIGFYPTPSSSGNTITYNYDRLARDMVQEDFTTGTITTTVVADKTVVGDSTSWTKGMAGNWLRITSGAADALRDGFWYEIDSITDGTNLELKRGYAGTALTAASAAYTIAEMPIIPDGYEDMIVDRVLWQFFMKTDRVMAGQYKTDFFEKLRKLKESYGSKSVNPGIRDGSGVAMNNPNLFIEL